MPLVFNPFLGSLDYVGTATGGGAVTGTGSAGQVAFWTGASNLSGDNAFEWDSVNKRVGLGTTTPASLLHEVQTGTSPGELLLADMYSTAGASGAPFSGPQIVGRKARGTIGAELPVIQNDVLLTLGARGWQSGGAFATGSRAGFNCFADESWTATAQGTYLTAFTTPDTTIAAIERLRIADDGSVLIGTSTKIAGDRVVVTGGALHVLAGNALRLQGAGAGFTSFVDPTHAANIAYTLPAAQATAAGQVLTNDATGVLSWATAGAGSASGDLSGTYPGPITVTRINGGLLGTTTPVTQGDLLVADATPSFARFGGNATATRNYLSMTSSVPLWTAIPGTDVTGAALTKLDDTNVTLTLGGFPATALLRAASLNLGWSGQLAVGRGGTGIASGTSGGILGFTGPTTLASSTLLTANALVLGGGAAATPSTPVGLGTTTTVLHGNAAGAPSFGSVVLTSGVTQDVTGILPPGNGGTGQSTLLSAFDALANTVLTTQGDLLTRDTSNPSRLGIGAIGRWLRSDGTNPVWVNPTLFDDFTQYTHLTGRLGTGNDTILNSGAPGVTGTLAGSTQQNGELKLLASSNGSGDNTSSPSIRVGSNIANIGGNARAWMLFDGSPVLNVGPGQISVIGVGNDTATGATMTTWLWSASTSVSFHALFSVVPNLQGSSAISNIHTGTVGVMNFAPTITADTQPLVVDAIRVHAGTSQSIHLSTGTTTFTEITEVYSQPGWLAGDSVGTGTATSGRRGLWYRDNSAGANLGTIGRSIAVDVDNITNAPTIVGAALRSAIVAGTNKWHVLGTGTAVSALVGGLRLGAAAVPSGFSVLHVDGGYTVKRTAPLAAAFPYTLAVTDYYLAVTDTTVVRTVNLPLAVVSAAGKVYVIKDESGAASTHNITIAANGGDTVDGGASLVIVSNFGVFRVYSDGVSKWFTF